MTGGRADDLGSGALPITPLAVEQGADRFDIAARWAHECALAARHDHPDLDAIIEALACLDRGAAEISADDIRPRPPAAEPLLWLTYACQFLLGAARDVYPGAVHLVTDVLGGLRDRIGQQEAHRLAGIVARQRQLPETTPRPHR